MNQSVSALGNAVRETRKSRNLSQEALAERIGVCKRTIIDIEKSTGNPKFEILCMLVRELDLPLYEVFYPEVSNNTEIKNILIKELSDCSDYEMKVILSVIRSLRCTLKSEEKTSGV
ncbi:MAG: helix-turn-helix domain-containing protein [Butyrivibrio sp.]|nr:helix-turn-helix domain-containing protein [Butyrivibrio sp.]